MEVLLFSFSISLDALGYSLGFGSKNIRINFWQFLFINLLNTLILCLYLRVFNNFEYIFKNPSIENISPFLLMGLGLYNIILSSYKKLKHIYYLKNKKTNIVNLVEQKKVFNANYFNFNIKNSASLNFLSCIDLFILVCVFIFENAFSTFIFYTNFKNAFLFVFSNFVFHFFFFLLGFNLGRKLASKINNNSSFISGYIFMCLAYIQMYL